MDKYKVVYFIENKGPISKVIEASGVGFGKDRIGDSIIFFDEHGENGYEFYKKDIIVYYRL